MEQPMTCRSCTLRNTKAVRSNLVGNLRKKAKFHDNVCSAFEGKEFVWHFVATSQEIRSSAGLL